MKIIGILILGTGILGLIHDWLYRHQIRRKRMEELMSFFRKAIYAMEETKTPWILFFDAYEGNDICVTESVHEVSKKLKENRYPKGELAWQDAMEEREKEWDFSKEAFELLLASGNAFFGKSQKENLELMRMYMKLFEECEKRETQSFGEKKKVWIPVGALGGIMLVIILI